MTEKELAGLRSHCGRLLSLPSPWEVRGVVEEFGLQRVVIEMELPSRTPLECPECGAKSPLHDRGQERAVERGLARRNLEGLRHVGLDEKSSGRGQNHLLVMTDIEGHRVLEVEPGRNTASAAALWRSLLPEQGPE